MRRPHDDIANAHSHNSSHVLQLVIRPEDNGYKPDQNPKELLMIQKVLPSDQGCPSSANKHRFTPILHNL